MEYLLLATRVVLAVEIRVAWSALTAPLGLLEMLHPLPVHQHTMVAAVVVACSLIPRKLLP